MLPPHITHLFCAALLVPTCSLDLRAFELQMPRCSLSRLRVAALSRCLLLRRVLGGGQLGGSFFVMSMGGLPRTLPFKNIGRLWRKIVS